MTKRHSVRVNFELPELTTAQVKLLWDFLDDLSSNLWEAYEDELFDLEAETFHAAEADADNCNASDDEPPSSPTMPPTKSAGDDEPEF